MAIGPATNGTERRLDAILEELTAMRKLLESQVVPKSEPEAITPKPAPHRQHQREKKASA